MNRKFAVGAIVGALLMSGLMVGVSQGGSAGAEPTVLRLHWNTRLEDSFIEGFLFDPNGEPCEASTPVCGQIELKDMPLFDKDNNEIGRQHISCTVSDTTEWFCSLISEIEDGPYTDAGQVSAIGVKKPNGNSHVIITGGTGAYGGMSGHGWKNGDDGRVNYTLTLIPSSAGGA